MRDVRRTAVAVSAALALAAAGVLGGCGGSGPTPSVLPAQDIAVIEHEPSIFWAKLEEMVCARDVVLPGISGERVIVG